MKPQKPPPGTYRVTFSGETYQLVITDDGALWNGVWIKHAWTWWEIPDYGPVLRPLHPEAGFLVCLGGGMAGLVNRDGTVDLGTCAAV